MFVCSSERYVSWRARYRANEVPVKPVRIWLLHVLCTACITSQYGTQWQWKWLVYKFWFSMPSTVKCIPYGLWYFGVGEQGRGRHSECGRGSGGEGVEGSRGVWRGMQAYPGVMYGCAFVVLRRKFKLVVFQTVGCVDSAGFRNGLSIFSASRLRACALGPGWRVWVIALAVARFGLPFHPKTVLYDTSRKHNKHTSS